MSVTSAVAQGRAAAEALMLDTLTAYANEWTEEDGLEVQTWVAQYTTRGRVAGTSSQSRDTNTRTITVGGVERLVMDGGLHIPLSAALPAIGWEFVCTSVGAGSDPSLVGRRWRVIDVPAKSFATARRLDVVEVPA